LNFLVFNSCTSYSQIHSKRQFKTIQFEEFVIEVPLSWQKVNLQGIDSFVGGVSDGEDTLVYDYGTYSTKFEEDVRIYPMEEKSLRPHKRSGATVVFSNTPEEDFRSGKYHQYYVNQDTISGYLAEITYPKKDTLGHYEIFVHDIYGNYDLKLYSANVSPDKRDEILAILRSLSL
jgi:hypothetical protein